MQWAADKRHGDGKYTFADGSCVYDGTWENDKRQGRGVELLSDGSKFVGQYVADIRLGL